MADKLNIPTPEPPAFNVDIFGYKNVAIGKAVNAIPEPYRAIVQTVLTPPSAQDIINDFLTRMPDPQQPVEKPALNIPKYSNANPTPTVAGATMNGGPLFSNFDIDSNQWTDFGGQVKGYRGMIFNTVLVSAQQQKNIVETEIQGSDDGAIFEYSGMNNYNVTVNLILVGNNNNGEYPQDEVQELIKALESPYPIKVNSWYLQMMNITELEVMAYDIPQVPGGISQQPVTIQAKSNKRTVLIIQ